MTLINDLHLAHSSMQQTANRARMLREAIWWANLSKAQGTVYIYQDARGLLTLSRVPAAGTLVATVIPDPMQYRSGEREEWREWQMHLGDRRY